MNRRFRTFPLGLAFSLLFAGVAGADVVHLKTGGRLDGVLVKETASSLTIDVGFGQLSVPKSSVSRIERKDSALSEYRQRLAALVPGDVRSLVALARFADENELRRESRQAWARVLSFEPGNVEAHLALGHVLVDGNYVDEAEANRALGLVLFEGRWMTPGEQAFLLREREQALAEERREREARRAAREEEDRERRAEAAAERRRAAAAAANADRPWGYGGAILVGSPGFGGYTAGCVGAACYVVPPMYGSRPPAPVATPLPRANPVRPSSIR
ncbi:MAG: hypothetical protein K1Y01_18060 [Vicinamibacteria bacterium]|nr:hypothetical protein [Vicinamibacteria bacterium]